ncbi:MAG TPA: nucleotidyltransferase family protein [Pyrinomonadaceae bacterium]|nr:nucleotidyltransferase family protein [Pyrinomonadaceae bacterium]
MQSIKLITSAPTPDDTRWYLLQNKANEARIREAFHLFRDQGIEPILIKGWAISRFYPDNHLRTYTDIDLAVSSAEVDKARLLLQTDSAKRLSVDLHDELRHLDTLGWDDLFARSALIDLEGASVRVLSEEDHLRVLCVHWLTDSGSSKERLWDIYYAVDRRSPGFDWAKCLGSVSDTRQKWIISAIGLANKYLRLSIEDLPFAEEAKRLPKWLTESIEREWEHGIPLRGLYDSLHDWHEFMRQMRKRLPPNPVYATIECEGEFDDRSRWRYQLKSLLIRAIPGIRKITLTLRARTNENG